MTRPLRFLRLLPAALLFVFDLAQQPLSAQATLPPSMVLVQGGTFTMGCTSEQMPNCQPPDSISRSY